MRLCSDRPIDVRGVFDRRPGFYVTRALAVPASDVASWILDSYPVLVHFDDRRITSLQLQSRDRQVAATFRMEKTRHAIAIRSAMSNGFGSTLEAARAALPVREKQYLAVEPL